jgi:hypothetical protein
VRFSLAYMDAATIEAKTCAIGAGVARPQVRPRPALHRADLVQLLYTRLGAQGRPGQGMVD